jgi:hypothetical protein
MPAYYITVESSFRDHEVHIESPLDKRQIDFNSEKAALAYARYWGKVYGCEIHQTIHRKIK